MTLTLTETHSLPREALLDLGIFKAKAEIHPQVHSPLPPCTTGHTWCLEGYIWGTLCTSSTLTPHLDGGKNKTKQNLGPEKDFDFTKTE